MGTDGIRLDTSGTINHGRGTNMPYRSRKQDRDQQIERRINDSYKYAKRPKQHKPDLEALEIMGQYPGMTWEEAVDAQIRAELARLNR
jgi:hypothetical protein